MKKNLINITNLCFLLAIVILDIIYMLVPYNVLSEYITKGSVTGAFLICGIVNLIFSIKNKKDYDFSPKFKWLMMLGLFFAALGDIFLIDVFVLGVGFFALGHVFYMLAFISLKKFNIRDIIIIALIFIPALLLILLYKGFDFDGMKLLIILYALILSTMTAKTISNYTIEKSKKNLTLVAGSALFFLSDLMLLFRLFAGAPRIMSILCVAFYYPAQFILAYSITAVSKTENKTIGE